MRIFYSVILFCLTLSMQVSGQASDSYVPKIIPPSPQAASLTKYVDIPVSYYTGTANISVPIYTIQQGKLSLPVSISYHPSGIKVAEEASQVGLGWSLNAGGVVSRTIMGEDDFTLSRYYSTTYDLQSNYFPQSYMQVGAAISGNQSAFNYSFYTQQSGPATVPLRVEDGTNNEYQPDIYSFNFAGYSGKFIISRSQEIIMNDKSDLRIKAIGLTSGTVSWEITTPDGTVYLFNERETFRYESGGTAVSSWFLSKITSAEGAEINLSYSVVNDAKNYPQGAIAETNGTTVLGNICTTTNGPVYSPTHTIERVSPKYISTKYLNEITFLNGSVKFNFGNREDLAYDKRLTSVQIYHKPNGVKTLLKSYDLSYSYFEGSNDADMPATTDGSGSISKRLKLLSVTEKSAAGTASKPYVFTYYEGGNFNLPAKTSFAQDHWGYYNGKTSNQSLIPTYSNFLSSDEMRYYFGQLTGTERDTQPAYIKAFSLKRLTQPTGGYTELDYEAHDYDLNNSNKNDYSYAGSQKTTVERDVYLLYNMAQKGVSQDFEIDFSHATTGQSGLMTLKLNAFVRFTNRVPCSTVSGQSGKVYFELIDKTTGLSVGVYDMLTMQQCTDNTNGQPSPCVDRGCMDQNGTMMTMGVNHINSFPGIVPSKYIWRAKASDGTGFVVADFAVHFTWFEPREDTPGAMANGGGLRLKTITVNDGVRNNIRTFSYRLTETVGGQSIVKSSGRLMTKPQYTYAEDRWCVETGMTGSTYRQYRPIFRTSNSIVPLNASAGGSVVGYDQVTVNEGSNGENGQSIFYYDNQSDVVNNFNYYRPPLVSSKPFKSNGNLLKQEDFIKSGSGFKKVKETNYEYYLSTPSQQYAAEIRYIDTYLGAGAIFSARKQAFFYPAMIKNWNYVKSESIQTYDPDNAASFTTARTEYFYNNTNYTQLSQTKALDSKGRKIVTAYKYPFDYTTGVYPAMVTKNMLSPVIEKTVSIEGGSTLSWVNTPYFNPTGSLYMPMKVEKKTGTGPVVTLVTFLTYDARGNLLTYKEGTGITTKMAYYGTTDVGLTDFPKSQTIGDGSAVAQTTNFTPRSLVGVETITDPAGKTLYYGYDPFSRLESIRNVNSEGAKRASFCYNYAGQPTPCAALAPTGSMAASSLVLIAEALPVTLIAFTAVKAEYTARLSWTTTAETNSGFFAVERSADGKGWARIGTVTAAGESVSESRYGFTDAQPLHGENLYRLKMADKDGTYAYSSIRSVVFDGEDVMVYPNPVTVGEKINLSVNKPETVKSITVFDAGGRMVKESGRATTIDMSGQPSGVYTVQVLFTDGSQSNHRVVKQ